MPKSDQCETKGIESRIERIVVCAPIKIGESDYDMGVMLQRDAQTQYLYLHNEAIEKRSANRIRNTPAYDRGHQKRFSPLHYEYNPKSPKCQDGEAKNCKKIERNTGSPRMQEASNPSTKARHTAGALSNGSRPADVLSVVTDESATTSTISITDPSQKVNTNSEKTDKSFLFPNVVRILLE